MVLNNLLGKLLLREPSSGYSTNRDEAMFGIQKAPLNMFREYSPSSTNLASDWLRAKEFLLWTRRKEKEKMDDGVDTLLISEGTDLFVGLWEAQPCDWD